jgi:hypothetical protein
MKPLKIRVTDAGITSNTGNRYFLIEVRDLTAIHITLQLFEFGKRSLLYKNIYDQIVNNNLLIPCTLPIDVYIITQSYCQTKHLSIMCKVTNCIECGSTFKPYSKDQQYCPTCLEEIEDGLMNFMEKDDKEDESDSEDEFPRT